MWIRYLSHNQQHTLKSESFSHAHGLILNNEQLILEVLVGIVIFY